MDAPVIELDQCILCEVCIDVCPEVFFINSSGGYIDIKELNEYPQDTVHEAVKHCPTDCISFNED